MLLACGLLVGPLATAAEAPEDEAPGDAEFIEYLGLWEETDEEWLMHDASQDGEDEPAMEAEKEDES